MFQTWYRNCWWSNLVMKILAMCRQRFCLKARISIAMPAALGSWYCLPGWPKFPSSLGCLIRSISALMSCHPEPIFSLQPRWSGNVLGNTPTPTLRSAAAFPCERGGDKTMRFPYFFSMHWSWSKSRHRRFLSFGSDPRLSFPTLLLLEAAW